MYVYRSVGRLRFLPTSYLCVAIQTVVSNNTATRQEIRDLASLLIRPMWPDSCGIPSHGLLFQPINPDYPAATRL